jgi:hypothetical protein
MLSIVIKTFTILSVQYAEFSNTKHHYADYPYAEYLNDECHYAEYLYAEYPYAEYLYADYPYDEYHYAECFNAQCHDTSHLTCARCPTLGRSPSVHH